MADETGERVLCAAIHFDDSKTKYDLQPPNVDTGFVVAGWRHGNCLALVGGIFRELKMARSRVKHGISETQGFITSKGRFVDRIVAADIAAKAGQINGERRAPKYLMSEDLY